MEQIFIWFSPMDGMIHEEDVKIQKGSDVKLIEGLCKLEEI